MAIVFKCKCCTGNLDVQEGMHIVECDYCGTKQTVPSSRDENIQNLFNRATTLRLKSEFDKASEIYERIIQADDEQSEAYWGLILCKFGVEYVEDPKTFKRIPTCHRTSYESVIADENYKLTLKYAYAGQKPLYEEEAKAIDKVQKGILAVAQNEEPYDVFICYKETDEYGKRTQDSVIANDIYHQLTQEGFKVFYAAITLEGKLGSAYEPIIFAALNSAKVMLAIGTKPEYFNAVWVKNEWSRFLKMNKDDRSKLLIPCYKDMDAYDLPDEFAHLQAQNMAKIGFINDIVRGIKKVLEKPAAPTVTVSAGGNTGNLLKRAYMFLNDGDFENAKIYCNKVLDIDAESADAYLYSLLVRLGIRKKESLSSVTTDFGSYSEYKRAYEYGNDERKEFLKACLEKVRGGIQERADKLAEEQRLKRLQAEKQNRIREAQEYVEKTRKAIKKLESANARAELEIKDKQTAMAQSKKKIKKAKLWAVGHLFSLAAFVGGLVMLIIFSQKGALLAEQSQQYEDYQALAMLGGFTMVAGIIMLAVSFFHIRKNHPNYQGESLLGSCVLVLFYDVIGIIYTVKAFALSPKKFTQKTQGEIARLKGQISHSQEKLTELQAELGKAAARLKALLGAEA